ncbi:FHA domain-containing protein [Actinoplanes sp. NEAU-A12]|uniref:FHA domain-containing protein n=1 Tax=Actinoplanes sandaracinus TaxID=3045177 RepID=A0ABT6WDQ0_9ACTN|nr:FHA domain-containing protein [Actinoplanes sandaracinus]MDI6097857.1 FHA domain-containing protein [Actinoplanes sandaracinus]
MRFEVSKVLDAIEARLTTDPALARAVVDLAEVVRYADLDGGRPASLVRLGLLVDALGRYVSEENVPVYVVTPHGLLSDTDLTSNERMVVRRWADDGKVEVVPQVGDRVLEVAEMLGLPVLTRDREDRFRAGRPWVTEPGRLLALVSAQGGPTLVARVGRGEVAPPVPRSPLGERLLARVWRCASLSCNSYGDGGDADSPFADMRTYTSPVSQPPPTLRAGVPTCPRHGERLRDVGPRPATEVFSVRIDGVIRQRFVVSEDLPAVIGRAPEGGSGVMLGQWLTDAARKWISRGHVMLTLRGTEVTAQDISMNGTGIRLGGSFDDGQRLTLRRDETRVLAADDVVELYSGVLLGRSKLWADGGVMQPESVMGEAPTMAFRPVGR